MNRRSLRHLLCAVSAAAFGAFGTAAQAIHYDVGFDPTTFAGILQIDVPAGPTCFTPGLNNCTFDVLGLDFTDSFGNEWDIAGPQIGAGSQTFIGSPSTLLALSAFVNNLQLISDSSGCGDFTGSPTLSFSIDSIDHTKTDVVFACGDHTMDTGIVTKITQVPEPATLALLGIAVSGLAWTRRRKRS